MSTAHRIISSIRVPKRAKTQKVFEATRRHAQMPQLSFQTFTEPWGPLLELTCPKLLPGEGCAPYRTVLTTQVTFEGLQAGDVSVIWRTRRRQELADLHSVRNCSGSVSETRMTPGRWTRSWINDHNGPSGASYIRLPPRLPPDEYESDWLAAEGMRALVWGGGRWLRGSSRMLMRHLQARDHGSPSKLQVPGPQISKKPRIL